MEDGGSDCFTHISWIRFEPFHPGFQARLTNAMAQKGCNALGRAVGEALEHTAADSAAVPLETTGTSLHQSRLTSYPIYPNAN